MDLRHPLRSVIPSLDWAVIEVLAGSRAAMGASQIARLADGSRQGQSHVLDRLVEHGLVIADPASRGYLYRLNRDHLAANAILEIIGARSELLRRLEVRAEALTPAPVHASVFGSFARGEAGPASDIDLLVVARDEHALDQCEPGLRALEQDVERWTGNRCRAMAFTPDRIREFHRVGEPIVANWLDDALLLTGRPLDALFDLDLARPTAPKVGE